MKYSVLFTLACATLAQAIPPASSGTEQGGNDLTPLNIADAEQKAVNQAETPPIESKVEAPTHELFRRMLHDIPIPAEADPRPVVLAGVSIGFIMTGRWVRQNGANVYRYFCTKLRVANRESRVIAVTIVNEGVKVADNYRMGQNRVDTITAPGSGIQGTIDLNVAEV